MPIYKMEGKKKDGLQKYRVRVNYTDEYGKHRQIDRIAYGMENAKRLEQELSCKSDEIANRRISISDLYDELVKFKQYNVRESSLKENVNIAFYMGLRKGEIHALKWTDVENNTMYIRRSINQKLRGEDRETPPNNKSSVRDVQIPKPLLEILKEHYMRCRKIDGFSDEWRICGGECCLRDTTLEKRNQLYAEKAGIKKIRIHDYRHSHALLLVNNGINIQEVARRLGHSKVEITWNTYSHLYPQEQERSIRILNTIE